MGRTINADIGILVHKTAFPLLQDDVKNHSFHQVWELKSGEAEIC
jgi:hypothetical protein